MLDVKTPLYRYISFERFYQMLFTKELTLVSPKLWPDSYELYWLKLLETSAGKRYLETYAKRFAGDTEATIKNIISACSFQYNNSFCLCFSLLKDSEVLWNARSDNHKCIMISTTVDKICNILECNHNYTIESIKYDLEESNIEGFLSKFSVYPEGLSFFDADDILLHKRKCFSYEGEARLILYPDQIVVDSVLKFPIPSLCDFIDDVMVHPAASGEYVALISLLCNKNDIPFGGKSHLYEFQPIEVE